MQPETVDSNAGLNAWCQYIVSWRKRKGFITNRENFAEKCMLIVTEISEAVEADRKGDDANLREELADTFIRLADLAGSLEIDLEYEVAYKMTLNEARPPKHGKRY